MNNTIKRLLLLLLLGGVIFTFFNCEYDEHKQTTNQSDGIKPKLTLSKVFFQGFAANKQLTNKLSSIATKLKNGNTINKEVYSTENSFSINTNFAMYIEDGNGGHSYTFKIHRVNSEFLLENLVLNLNDSLGYDMYIVHYNITASELEQIKQGQSPNLSQKTSITSITDNDFLDAVFSKIDVDVCLLDVNVTSSLTCICEGHTWGDSTCGCTSYQSVDTWTYTYGSCPGGGGANNNDTGGYPTGTGSGWGSGVGTQVNTVPVEDFEDEESEVENNPCDKLKNLFNLPQPDIKSAIQNHLQLDIPNNPNGEKAAYLQKLPNGTMGTTISAPTPINSVGIRSGGNFYSAIHTHNTGLYPMFSYSDVVVLNNLNNNAQPHNQGTASFLLTCIDDNNIPQTYAIVFDPNNLSNSLDYFLNTPENNGCTQAEIKDELDILLGEEFANDSNYERVFLKFMAHTNVSLYKANSSLTNWNKLSIGIGFNNSVNSTPCK